MDESILLRFIQLFPMQNRVTTPHVFTPYWKIFYYHAPNSQNIFLPLY
ncbi:hypothetical protein MC7420_3243 [Coleofasciculus chthonoplastes PCC 7420]|uniref:Uncharacterized protein n=1 Tax=Coleofasciculus chthonoplastes PCC 7420 TaxID=118168 RepID=B4VZ50_9CYAN|nr:hypothetical protein MC7420_3243 [Coleofasciculus chthonoplastes PCC 7420]